MQRNHLLTVAIAGELASQVEGVYEARRGLRCLARTPRAADAGTYIRKHFAWQLGIVRYHLCHRLDATFLTVDKPQCDFLMRLF